MGGVAVAARHLAQQATLHLGLVPVRPASQSILSAVERTEVQEDRLTEVLACVTQVNRGLGAALLTMAGLRIHERERYVVGTQRGTPGGRRVDMEIAVYDGLRRTKLVWIEAKDGAAYQPNQLSDYAEQVRDRVVGDPDGRVLTIIPPGMGPELDPTPGPARWTTTTWSEVALAAERVGQAWGRKNGSRRWRSRALEPSAPAEWRYLVDIIGRLEEKGYARMDPLSPEDVIAAQRYEGTKKALEDMVKAAAQSLDGLEVTKDRGIAGGAYCQLAPPTSKWFSDSERYGNAYPELLYYREDDWTPDRLGAPAFCAGITFSEPGRETRVLLGDEAWQAGLPQGVTVGGNGHILRVVRTMYLSELIVTGSTFEEQLRALRAWADAAIRELCDDIPAPPEP